jgi:zinc protease
VSGEQEGWSAEPNAVEVDGVPVRWLEAPSPLTAALTFRVGRADESFHTSGITHLVEHLALSQLGVLTHQYNGFVEQTRAVAHVSGSESEIVSFLEHVCRALNELPLDRLETEKQVLYTESSRRPRSMLEDLYRVRFGARGYGLVGYPEFGLRRITTDEVREWVASHFTRENAILWVSGPPPPGLTLPLPSGQRRSPPAVEPVDAMALPARAGIDGPAVGLAVLGKRSVGLGLGLSIAAKRAHEELRAGKGITYSVEHVYDGLTATDAHAALAADALPEHARAVAEGLLSTLSDLSEKGPTDEELRRECDTFAPVLDIPGAIPGFLDNWVANELIGAELRKPEEILGEMRATTAQQVIEELRQARPSLITVFQGAEESGLKGTAVLDVRSPGPVRGKSFRPVGIRKRKGVRIDLSETGVTLTQDSEQATVPFERCVGVLMTPDGAQVLVRDDGASIEFLPKAIRSGDELRAAIRSRLAENLVIPLGPEAVAADVVEKAAEDLPRRWPVDRELAALRERLATGERIALMAEASIGLTSGLLTLTDRNLIFLAIPGSAGRRQEDIVVPRSDVHDVQARGQKVRVTFRAGDKITFKDIVPPERAIQLASSLGAWPVRRDWLPGRRIRPLAMAIIAVAIAVFGRAFFAWLWALGTLGDVASQGGVGRKVTPRSVRWMNRAAVALAAAAAVLASLPEG